MREPARYVQRELEGQIDIGPEKKCWYKIARLDRYKIV